MEGLASTGGDYIHQGEIYTRRHICSHAHTRVTVNSHFLTPQTFSRAPHLEPRGSFAVWRSAGGGSELVDQRLSPEHSCQYVTETQTGGGDDALCIILQNANKVSCEERLMPPKSLKAVRKLVSHIHGLVHLLTNCKERKGIKT